MARCNKEKELVITTEDKPGMLSQVTSAISEKGVNIVALCAYAMESKAIFMVITDNNQKAKSAAESKGWKTEESDVVVLEANNKVGAAKEIGDKLKAKNISLSYCYGTTCSPESSGACRIVLKSDNNDALIQALK